MKNTKIFKCLGELYADERGDGPVQMTLLVGGVALAVAVLSAPLLDRASKQFASARSQGVDQILTGSIGTSKRYTVRRSVLEPGEVRICRDGATSNCN